MIDDEEKKKREEEFDNYFSHSTTSTEKEQRANYFDSYFSGNNKFTESNGFETDPTTIKQELNDIMNKKPEIKLSQPLENDNDVEELDTTTRVQNRFLNNSSLFKDEETVKEESKPDERVNVIMNNRKLSSLMTDEEKQEVENQEEFASRSNSDKNLFSQFGKMLQNFLLGVTSGGKQFLKTVTKTSNNQKQVRVSAPDSVIPIIVQEEYNSQQNENSLLNQQIKKKIDNTNMFKIRFNNTNNENDTIQEKINLSNESIENLNEKANRVLSEYTDSFGDIELNPLTRSLDRSIREDETKIASNSNEISNPIIKKVSELAPSAGNSLAGAGISFINPYLGTSYFIVSAMGSYEDDARNRGMSKREAEAYGKIMGFMEGATEMIGVDKLISGSKSILKGSFKEAFKDFGLNVLDNAIQEAVIDPVDEIVSAGISGKANKDYTTVEGGRELIGEMVKDGFDGALSAIITGGVDLGISSSVRLYNKISNNENITQREVQQVYNDIQKDGRLNVNDIIKDSFNYQKDKMLNDNQGVYMALTFDNDGTLTEVRQAYGEKFDLTNNNLNVEPAVVDIDGYYNIIDTTSGLKLDTTQYNSKTEAIDQFNNKISNLDNSAINSINRQVEKSKLSIMNEMQRMNEVQAQQNADYYFNNRETPSNNTQDSQGDILNDNETNYTNNTENNVKNANNVLDEISKLTRQIQDKTRYHAANIEDIANYVSKRLDNVKVEQTPSGNSIVYSTDNQGNITYSQELNFARAYRGSEVKDIVNSLVSNADIPVRTSTSNNKDNTSKKANKSTFYDDTKKYIITNINNATNEFDNNTTYTKKKVNEIVSNIYNNDYLTEYDNDGNIKNYVAIEDKGNNLIAKLYDGEDNLVKSEVIPKENGKYTGKNITDTIRKLTRIENQNRPIKGQLDVEGNEIRSMKKKNNNENIMNNYDNKTASLIKKSKRDTIIENTKQLNNLIEEALNSQNNKALHLGKLNENIIKELKTEIKNLPKNNKDFLKRDSYDLIINQSEIRHLTDKKNNLTKKDIKRFIKLLPELIINNDYVSYTKDTNGEGLRFKKLMSDGTYVSFVIVSNKKGTMKVKTIYMEKGDYENKKRSISPPNDVNKTPNNTSKTSRAFASINNSITQKNTSVKNATKQSMQNGKIITLNQEKIQKELHNRIQNAILSRNSRKNTYLGKVSNNVVRKVKTLLNIDISNRTHLIADNDIRHMIKQHGNPEIEKARGQIAITSKDIEKIPEILNNYDSIIQGSDNKQGKTIRYIKEYPNNQTYIVEVIPTANDTSLYVKTMWKKRFNNKKEPVTLTNSKNAPSSTSKTRGNLGSNNSIPQNIQNVKDDGVRAMKKNNSRGKTIQSSTIDNQGRTLSEQQQEYFKDSKARDIDGNLLTVYHGTDRDFTQFKNKPAQHGRAIIDGYYLTPNKENANTYGNKLMELYVNIKNPLYLHNNDGLTTELVNRGYAESSIDLIEKYNLETDDSGVVATSKALTKLVKDLGYDGIITTTSNNDEIDTDFEYTQIVALRSNQIKNVDNLVPTKNGDIRFDKKNITDTLEPGQTNAQREGSYIEDEIKTVEATGNWDDSIPVTKLSDINKVIEDYLGLGIKRGKFRQRAYGIYKGNRDVLRVKEYKDMDTLLHETGHALDLRNRIKVDKESIADELLKAIDRYGGYEDESRTIRLDEGFAEVIREYGIKPTQAKIDYPQTVAVLENIREADQSFDNFITKVQEMTYNYIHQNPENRVLSNISIGEQTDKEPVTKQRIKTEVMRNIYDSNYALKEAVSKLAKNSGKTVNDLRASENAYLLTRLSSGIGEKVTSMLADGYIDENGNKLFEGLNKMGEILGNDPQRYNDLRAYLVAQRDLEYKAKTLKTGIRTMDSRAVINQFKNDTEIQEAAKLVYNTVDGVLQYAVNNNLITAENAKALRESNAFYVPMQRVLEKDRGNNVGRRGGVSSIIKQRTGSELDIKDILENIVSNSANIIQQVENNNVLKALYKQGESSGMTGVVYDVIPAPMTKIGTATLSTWELELRKQGVNTNELDLEKSIDLFAPNNKVDTKNLITSFIDDDGKRIYLQFNDEMIFNNILGMDKRFMSKVLKINSKLNMPLRYGATMANVGFAIPNMISDTAQAAIYSTAGFVPVIDNAIGVLDILAAESKTVSNFLNKVAPEYASKVNFMYQLYRQSGSPSSTRLSQYRKSTQENMNKIYGTTGSTLGINERFKPLKRVMDLLTYVPDISEQSTRFRVFQKNYDYYKSRGNSEMDSRIMAAIEARDATQDFGRTGNITREINQLIPFSAARVGSAYTFSEKISANPKMIGTRIAILTAVAMTIKAIGYDDDEIEELIQRKKDDNFVLKIGDNVVTIKKPQGILRSIINLSEYIQDLATGHIEEGKEGERLGEWLNNAIMDNMPADEVTGLVPNAVAPLIENAINKDFYYNTDIVKSYDLELPDSEQYYDYNSQLAILLGKVFNYSPAKIDNLISGYFAGLGTSVTNMIDYGLGKLGVIPEKPEMGAESNAVGKRFIVNVNSNSQSVNDIYDRKTELTKKKNGGTITSKETEELETITQAISQLSALNKQIKSIKADKKLSGDEKAEQIKELQKQKTDTARQALGKKLIYKDNQSKINSTKFYPSRSTLSLNGYSLTLTSDMMKEYENLAYKKYNEYAKQGIYSDEYLEKLEDKCKDYAKKTMLQKYKSQLVKTK